MAASKPYVHTSNDNGCHEPLLQRLSKVSWTEEEPAPSVPSIDQQIRARRYDIATLMLLRVRTNTETVQLRINPVALNEDVFRLSSQRASIARSRFRTRAGTFSGPFDSTTDEDLPYRGFASKHGQGYLGQSRAYQNNRSSLFYDGPRHIPVINPVRQPYAPPKTPLLQKDQGFANFIKQHASPTHVRVTAGGRIVPTRQPPIMPDLGTMKRQAPMLRDSQSHGAYNGMSSFTGFPPEAQAQAGLNENVGFQLQKNNDAVQYNSGMTNQFSGSLFPTMQPQIIAANNGFPQALYPVHRIQYAPSAPMTLSDGSIIHVQNGITYRSYFNGFSVVTDALNNAHPLGLPLEQQMGNLPSQNANPPMLSTSVQCQSKVPQQHSTQSIAKNSSDASADSDMSETTMKALQLELESLRSKLTALDKHIALHRHRLTPLEYHGCVAQRKHFVETIDCTRMKLESTGITTMNGHAMTSATSAPRTHAIRTSTGTYIATNHGTHETYDLVPLSGANQHTVQGPKKDTALRRGPRLTNSQHQTTKAAGATGLSPIAPSFVPGGVDTSPLPFAPDKNTKPSTLNNQLQTMPSLLPRRTDGSLLSENKDGGQSAKDSPKVLAYCKRREISPASDRKLFCSTEDDFAAVIHRVREQASVLGCKGGQSKDPAYDAEQDIRWAMADGDPIPLAQGLPEYFFNPRPWNWEDSEFNYRIPMRKVPDGNQCLGGYHRECISEEEPVYGKRHLMESIDKSSKKFLPNKQSTVEPETFAHETIKASDSKATTGPSKTDLEEGPSQDRPDASRRDAALSEPLPQTPSKGSREMTPLKEVTNVGVRTSTAKTVSCKALSLDPEDKEQIDPQAVAQQTVGSEPLTPTRCSGRAGKFTTSSEGSNRGKGATNFSPTKVGVPRFLQKLLRSPRQSAACGIQSSLATATNLPPPAASSALGKEISKRICASDSGASKSAVATQRLRRTSRLLDHQKALSSMYTGQIHGSQKTQSSIAPTELHAHGHVPPVQRASVSARHHLQPWKNASVEEPHIPQYDGADERPRSTDDSQVNGTSSTERRVHAEAKGENRAGSSEDPATGPVMTFQTYRQDLPRDHGLQVDRFFKDLAEMERQEMAAVAAKGGKA